MPPRYAIVYPLTPVMLASQDPHSYGDAAVRTDGCSQIPSREKKPGVAQCPGLTVPCLVDTGRSPNDEGEGSEGSLPLPTQTSSLRTSSYLHDRDAGVVNRSLCKSSPYLLTLPSVNPLLTQPNTLTPEPRPIWEAASLPSIHRHPKTDTERERIRTLMETSKS